MVLRLHCFVPCKKNKGCEEKGLRCGGTAQYLCTKDLCVCVSCVGVASRLLSTWAIATPVSNQLICCCLRIQASPPLFTRMFRLTQLYLSAAPYLFMLVKSSGVIFLVLLVKDLLLCLVRLCPPSQPQAHHGQFPVSASHCHSSSLISTLPAPCHHRCLSIQHLLQ